MRLLVFRAIDGVGLVRLDLERCVRVDSIRRKRHEFRQETAATL